MKALIGWYSEEALLAGSGTVWYATPDGREIEITAAIPEGEDEIYRWSDKVNKGPVARFLYEGKPSKRARKWRAL